MTDKFGIMNVPTVVFIRDGKEIDRLVGIAGKNVYQEKINSML